MGSSLIPSHLITAINQLFSRFCGLTIIFLRRSILNKLSAVLEFNFISSFEYTEYFCISIDWSHSNPRTIYWMRKGEQKAIYWNLFVEDCMSILMNRLFLQLHTIYSINRQKAREGMGLWNYGLSIVLPFAWRHISFWLYEQSLRARAVCRYYRSSVLTDEIIHAAQWCGR